MHLLFLNHIIKTGKSKKKQRTCIHSMEIPYISPVKRGSYVSQVTMPYSEEYRKFAREDALAFFPVRGRRRGCAC